MQHWGLVLTQDHRLPPGDIHQALSHLKEMKDEGSLSLWTTWSLSNSFLSGSPPISSLLAPSIPETELSQAGAQVSLG